MAIHTNRRHFLTASLAGSAAISLSGSVPNFLLGASRPAQVNRDEKIMVVVQLSGGNDGLNTVVPYGDDEYYKNRFTLAIGKQQVLKINDHVGFHPAMKGFSKLHENGNLAVVQGVGYPNPNRSHFESMDLWHSAHQMQQSQTTGWLGRTVDSNMAHQNLPAIHFGRDLQPLALKTDKKPIPSIRSIDNFRLDALNERSDRKRLAEMVQRPRGSKNSLLSYVHESANVAIETSHKLEKVSRKNSNAKFPRTELGKNLSVIAQLINSGLETRIYYTARDGFDTHSNQADSHYGLLQDVSDSIAAFNKEIEEQGNGDRVVVLAFSEFGRRLRENASRGTDHGAAAPLFVCGSAVKKGLIGKHPSLTDLDEGDVKFKIDYRSVYSDLMQNWMGIESEQIVGGKFKPVGLVG